MIRREASLAAAAVAGAALFASAGCAPEAGFRDAPAPALAQQSSVTGDARAAAEKTAEAFLAALKAKDGDAARAALATPPAAGQPLDAWLKAERLEPLSEASDWKVDDVRTLGKNGDKLLLRASFRTPKGPYRTNVTLSRKDGTWRVADVLPPVLPAEPSVSGPSGAAAAPKVGG